MYLSIWAVASVCRKKKKSLLCPSANQNAALHLAIIILYGTCSWRRVWPTAEGTRSTPALSLHGSARARANLLRLYYLGGEGVVSNNYIAAILSNEMGLLHSKR